MIIYDQYLYPEKPDVDDDVVVFHSGFASTSPNYTYGKDMRDYYLIHYITKGKGTYNTGKQVYHLSKYDGFLILPGTTIIHQSDAKDPWDVCWVAFFGRKIKSMMKSAGLDENNLIFHYDKDDFLENCIKDIYAESRDERQDMNKIIGYFYLFIAKLIENNQTTPLREIVKFTHFEDAINYIKRNIHTQISINHLANYLRLDTSQVYRIFKQKTNMSPQQYITDMRIQKSCDLLRKTDLTIKDIAEWMDFEYQSHFTKIFKNNTGMTPSEYRKKHLEERSDNALITPVPKLNMYDLHIDSPSVEIVD